MKDISENGQGYDGIKKVDWEGRKCISWEKHIQTYQRHYHQKTKYPSCRNFHIDSPVVFCLVKKGPGIKPRLVSGQTGSVVLTPVRDEMLNYRHAMCPYAQIKKTLMSGHFRT